MATPISNHFSLEEFTSSSTAKAKGIINMPGIVAIVNMTYLCDRVLEPLRKAMGYPIKIGSGFRCKALNKEVGGASNSQHLTGQAADLCIDGDIQKGRKWFEYIKKYLPFDQLIWERNPKTGSCWVHVSYNAFGNNRQQVIDGLVKK
jgi:hypothetical protein